MPSPKTQPARGMRDFLPADVRKREYAIGVIKSVYERYGFEPLETPAVENIETLMGKYGEEGNQLIFKILKRGEHEKTGKADLALRYDLTVPLARVVAQYQNELPKFFKRYQIQPVWRADRPARGRFREFYQCDVDVLGSRSMVVEAELIAAASDALVALGFNDFTIRVNHRRLLDAMMRNAMIEKETSASVLVVIDKLDKIGKDGVKSELAKLDIPEPSIDTILHLMMDQDPADPARLGHLFQFSEDNVQANLERIMLLYQPFKVFPATSEGNLAAGEAMGDLSRIVELSRNTSAARHIKIDTSLARGLSYYTGAIMEINVDGIGSLGGGGRYDNLIGMFSKRSIPACGLSLGLERIILVMTERGMFRESVVRPPADLMIASFDDESQSEAFSLAAELRTQGVRVFLNPEPGNPGKHRVYARDRDIPFLIVVGSTERESGIFRLENSKITDRVDVSRQGIGGAIKQKLKAEAHKHRPLAEAIEPLLSKPE
jgi:histidyl-tRNA synthetase